MATPQKKVTNPIIQRIMADGVFSAGMPKQNLSTESKLNIAQQGTFDAFRGGLNSAPSFEQQNLMANNGIYQAGTFGAGNALNNGLPVADFGGPSVSSVGPDFSGGAINQAFNAIPVGGPSLGASRPSNVFGAGLPAGMGTALSVDTSRQMYDEGRQQQFLKQFQVTPGMAPEMAASRFGSQDMLALRANGIAPSAQVNPVFSWVSPNGTPTLTNRAPDGSTSLGQPSGAAPTTTAYDQNRQAVGGIAQVGRQELKRQAVEQQQAKALAAGLPKGFVVDPNDPTAVKPLKGSLEELQYRKLQQEMGLKEQETDAAKAKSATALANSSEKANLVIDTVNKALTKTGVFNQATGFIPFTPGADLSGLVDTIKANIGFAELNAMRQASPTGGALGQVAVRELDFLQSALGNLSLKQSPKQLEENLRGVTNHYNRWLKTTQGVNPDSVKKVGRFEVVEEK